MQYGHITIRGREAKLKSVTLAPLHLSRRKVYSVQASVINIVLMWYAGGIMVFDPTSCYKIKNKMLFTKKKSTVARRYYSIVLFVWFDVSVWSFGTSTL